MKAYYDTGSLLPLYVEEVFSDVVTQLVEARKEPIAFNMLQEIEFENAMRLKVFRRDISTAQLHAVLAARDEDIQSGRLVRRLVNWPQVFVESQRISAASTIRTGCRTLDVLHVAIAVKWGCELFVTADDRQAKAAKMAGLKAFDLRGKP